MLPRILITLRTYRINNTFRGCPGCTSILSGIALPLPSALFWLADLARIPSAFAQG